MKEGIVMTRYQKYILDERKTIGIECRKKGIAASEWVKKYAVDYRRKCWNSGARNKSRWASWLEWVNDK